MPFKDGKILKLSHTDNCAEDLHHFNELLEYFKNNEYSFIDYREVEIREINISHDVGNIIDFKFLIVPHYDKKIHFANEIPSLILEYGYYKILSSKEFINQTKSKSNAIPKILENIPDSKEIERKVIDSIKESKIDIAEKELKIALKKHYNQTNLFSKGANIASFDNGLYRITHAVSRKEAVMIAKWILELETIND